MYEIALLASTLMSFPIVHASFLREVQYSSFRYRHFEPPPPHQANHTSLSSVVGPKEVKEFKKQKLCVHHNDAMGQAPWAPPIAIYYYSQVILDW